MKLKAALQQIWISAIWEMMRKPIDCVTTPLPAFNSQWKSVSIHRTKMDRNTGVYYSQVNMSHK
jgi:hypothetical protein